MKPTLAWCRRCRLYVRRLPRHSKRHHPREPMSLPLHPPSSPPATRQPPTTPPPMGPESPVPELPPLESPLSPWLEDTPAIELLEDNAPVENGGDPSVSAAPDVAAAVEPPTAVPATVSVGTQADGSGYAPTGARRRCSTRGRRQLFNRVARLHRAAPYDRPAAPSGLSLNEDGFANTIDANHQRRLCDCRTCVRHAVRLATRFVPREMPLTPGIRLVTLPGVRLPSAPREEIRAVVDFLTEHPEQSLVVCGCTSCILHRNLAKAWSQVRHFPPRSPPSPGGRRMSRP